MKMWWDRSDIIGEQQSVCLTPQMKRQLKKLWKELKKTHTIKTIHFGKDDNTLTTIEEKK